MIIRKPFAIMLAQLKTVVLFKEVIKLAFFRLVEYLEHQHLWVRLQTQNGPLFPLKKYSDPLLSTLLKQLWQWLQPQIFLGMTLQAWHTCICGVSPILLRRSSQPLSGWMRSIAAQLFSGLSRDVWSGSCPGSGRATQGHSKTWLCASGRSPVGRWTFTPVWSPENSGAGFHQGSLCTVLCSSFPRSWLVSHSLLLKNIPTA